MERCTRALQNATRFHNDERLIKVWIAYADEMSNPDDIFKFLHKNQIGGWRARGGVVGWCDGGRGGHGGGSTLVVVA